MFESLHLTDDVRAEQPGNSVQLSNGTVYYQLDGSEHGDLVVLIHGMSIPSFVWDPTYKALIAAGFRVLRYDLFGRGYSDRPKARYNMDLYTRQLVELLEALGVTEQHINLIGMSLGGAIAASFALHHPKIVQRIGLIDPIHPHDMPSPPSKIYKLLLKINTMAAITSRQVVNGLPNNFFCYEDFPEFEAQFSDQLSYKGFATAIMSTLIDFKYAQLPEIYEQIGQLAIPTCLIWGEADQQSNIETSETFKKHIPSLQFHAIAEAGHLPHYERPDLVNPILLDFLTS
ncbi:MAG: alpha/beta hydrolase [Chloroflexi bacterium]|nr:alpha/beta hydrolase [Chloroflexota bacterium]